MNRNRIRNHEALTPIRIPKMRPSANELPPSIYGEWSHSIARRTRSERNAMPHEIEEMNA
jgi:hypothetical protein